VSCLLSADYSGELPRQNKHKETTTNAEISKARTKRHIRNKALHLIYCQLKVNSEEKKNIHYKKYIVTHTTNSTNTTTATTTATTNNNNNTFNLN
jgi:hypothetical protein